MIPALTPEEFLLLVQAVNKAVTAKDLTQKIAETPLDSLDLLQVRASIEARLRCAVPDSIWMTSDTLMELLSRL